MTEPKDMKIPAGMGKAGEGTNVTESSTNPAATGAGNLGAADTAGEHAASGAGQTKESAGYPLKVSKKGHTHAGQDVKKGATIMLDMAEYRWALEHKIGTPGNADDVGQDVDSKGEVVTEKTIEELEAEATKS